MNRIAPALVLTIIFLASCTNPPATSSSPAGLTPALSTSSIPTVTPSVPTSTIIPTSEIRFTKQCLSIDDRETEMSDLTSGTIQLYSVGANYPFILKDVQSGVEYNPPVESKDLVLGTDKISPNRNMVTVMGYDKQHFRMILWVLDAKSNILAKISIQRNDLGPLQWIDNQHLMINTNEYGVLFMANPFTGEQRVIKDELPNLQPFLHFEPSFGWPVTYGPNLELVAYYSSRKEKGDYTNGPVVYDILKKQILWDAGNQVGSNPAWSPDGQELAITGGMDEYQLYLFSHSGQVKAILDKSLPHEAKEFSWSPDGRFIAFWNAGGLMVYDRQKDWVFDTCITGVATISPDWSPDSQQFIINQVTSQPLLVDWKKKAVYKIKYIKGSRIIGWMNSQP